MSPQLDQAPRFMLVSDLDHTMVQHHEPTHRHLLAFNRVWQEQLGQDCKLVFSTGRSPLLYRQLWEESPLMTPDFLICSVGTELFRWHPTAGWQPDRAWQAHLDQGWDKAKAAEIASRFGDLKPQVASEQRRHKLSYHLHISSPAAADQLLIELRAALADAGINAKVIYSGSVDVDILAGGAGKGAALDFLLKELKAQGTAPRDGCMVCGDSGNDVELFQVPGVHGCVVSNAHSELMDWALANPRPTLFIAKEQCAGGILQALQYFGFASPDASTSLPIVNQVRRLVWELGCARMQLLALTEPAEVRTWQDHLALLVKDGSVLATCQGSGVITAATPQSDSHSVAPCSHADHTTDHASAASITYQAPSAKAAAWVDQVQVRVVEGDESDPKICQVSFVAYELLPDGMRNTANIRPCNMVAVKQTGSALGFVASGFLDYVLEGRHLALPPIDDESVQPADVVKGPADVMPDHEGSSPVVA